MSKIQEQIERARLLSEWCDGPGGLWDIFSIVEKELITAWVESAEENESGRRALYNLMRGLKEVRTLISIIISSAEGRKRELAAKEAVASLKPYN